MERPILSFSPSLLRLYGLRASLVEGGVMSRSGLSASWSRGDAPSARSAGNAATRAVTQSLARYPLDVPLFRSPFDSANFPLFSLLLQFVLLSR
jgi:hypothetical protein